MAEKLDRVFRIDFYPHDWLTDTGRMTVEQRGVFIQICAMIYANRGPIINDPAWIGRAANCSARLAKSLIEQLVALGSLQVQGSKITQKRCEHELNRKRTHAEHSAKGGRTSPEKGHEYNENNHLSPSEHEYTPLTPSPSPSPSPSSIIVGDTNVSPTVGSAKKTKPKNSEPEGFDNFWKLYPKQRAGSRDKARLAYASALGRATAREILEAVEAYAASDAVARGYAKGAAAWLNDDRWTDTPSQTKPKGENQNGNYAGRKKTWIDAGEELAAKYEAEAERERQSAARQGDGASLHDAEPIRQIQG